jgi:hypothetical protein
VQSLEQQFAAWVRTKPEDGAYEYSDHCGCAMHQFLVAAGYPVRHVWAHHWVDTSGREHWFDGGLGSRLGEAVRNTPHNFGALAKRLAA